MDRSRTRLALVVGLLLGGMLLGFGGFGAGCVVLVYLEPPRPEALAHGAPGTSMTLHLTGQPDERHDLEFGVSVDMAMTRPEGRRLRYVDRVDYVLTLTRGSPAHATERLDGQLLDELPASGLASGVWMMESVRADASGVVEGSVVLQPSKAAHGMQPTTLQRVPHHPGVSVLLGLVAIGVLGVLLFAAGIVGFLTAPRRAGATSG